MNERLLQFIWQFQYFNKEALVSCNSEPVQILHPGTLNTNQGPDFLEARIKIDSTVWVGNIELHIRSSEWDLHKHSADKNYQNIILHVVWENDQAPEEKFSTIELKDRVSKLLLARYHEWMKSITFIPCEKNISHAKEIIWLNWKQRLMIERLQVKSEMVSGYLEKSNNHWEEVFWWLLAKNFGSKVNGEAFERVAQTISVNILAKHKNQIHQTEALLLGQAGLLDNDFSDAYAVMLKKEFQFLRSKYKLQKADVSLHFLRMRPSNFPTIRFAQLAAVIHNSTHLFSVIRETRSFKKLSSLFHVTANDYWHYHYVFDELSAYREKHVGRQMVDNILINTVVTILFAYGHFRNEVEYKERALKWLEEIPAEKNTITNGYVRLGIDNKSAFDSQALIQLKNEYCNKRRCLECAVGNSILKKVID